jgi:chromosome segregation ATPase
MVIFGKKNGQKDSGEESFRELQEFSEDLIVLGKEIEEKLKKKSEIEDKLNEREIAINKLRSEMYGLKEQLIKVNLELAKLEERRKKSENVQDSGQLMRDESQ